LLVIHGHPYNLHDVAVGTLTIRFPAGLLADFEVQLTYLPLREKSRQRIEERAKRAL